VRCPEVKNPASGDSVKAPLFSHNRLFSHRISVALRSQVTGHKSSSTLLLRVGGCGSWNCLSSTEISSRQQRRFLHFNGGVFFPEATLFLWTANPNRVVRAPLPKELPCYMCIYYTHTLTHYYSRRLPCAFTRTVQNLICAQPSGYFSMCLSAAFADMFIKLPRILRRCQLCYLAFILFINN